MNTNKSRYRAVCLGLLAITVFGTTLAFADYYNTSIKSQNLGINQTSVAPCSQTQVIKYWCKDCGWIWEYVPFTCNCSTNNEVTVTNTTSGLWLSGSAHISDNDSSTIGAAIPVGEVPVGIQCTSAIEGGYTLTWNYCWY